MKNTYDCTLLRNFLSKMFQIVANNYTCWKGYYCSSLYDNSIWESIDSVAFACSSDSNCKAFRYNPNDGFGFKCKEFDQTKSTAFRDNHYELHRYKKEDWILCSFESGEKHRNSIKIL